MSRDTESTNLSQTHAAGSDEQLLASMGYKQELSRRMKGFSNFAISFSIICILSGGINSLGQGISSIGGASIGIGWPIGCLVSLLFALGMAQIASAYPTAGGLYHWGSVLGGRGWGWLTAWLNLIGLVTVLGAINVGTYYFFIGAFGTQLACGAEPILGRMRGPADQRCGLALVGRDDVGGGERLAGKSQSGSRRRVEDHEAARGPHDRCGRKARHQRHLELEQQHLGL